jgi:hypothetical protein
MLQDSFLVGRPQSRPQPSRVRSVPETMAIFVLSNPPNNSCLWRWLLLRAAFHTPTSLCKLNVSSECGREPWPARQAHLGPGFPPVGVADADLARINQLCGAFRRRWQSGGWRQ